MLKEHQELLAQITKARKAATALAVKGCAVDGIYTHLNVAETLTRQRVAEYQHTTAVEQAEAKAKADAEAKAKETSTAA